MAHRVDDHALNQQIRVVVQLDGRIAPVAGPQQLVVQVQHLAGQLAVDGGDHYIAVLGLQGAVDDQQVAVEDTEAGHGIPLGAGEEGGRRVFHQVVVDIQRRFHKVVRRAGEAGACGAGEW